MPAGTENGRGYPDEAEAMKIIGAAGVPAGGVHDTLELWNEESFVERGIMQTMKHPDGDWKC